MAELSSNLLCWPKFGVAIHLPLGLRGCEGVPAAPVRVQEGELLLSRAPELHPNPPLGTGPMRAHTTLPSASRYAPPVGAQRVDDRQTPAAVVAGPGLPIDWHAVAAVPYADEERLAVSSDGDPHGGRIGDL